MMAGTTVAMIDGHKWYWWRTRLCDEYYHSNAPKKLRWFLRDENDFVNDFPTKREMMKWLDEEGPAWITGFQKQAAA